jgi:hypothetical protein
MSAGAENTRDPPQNLFATALLIMISQAASAETGLLPPPPGIDGYLIGKDGQIKATILRGNDGVWTVRARDRRVLGYIRRQLYLDSVCTREGTFGRHDPATRLRRCRSKSWVWC